MLKSSSHNKMDVVPNNISNNKMEVFPNSSKSKIQNSSKSKKNNTTKMNTTFKKMPFEQLRSQRRIKNIQTQTSKRLSQLNKRRNSVSGIKKTFSSLSRKIKPEKSKYNYKNMIKPIFDNTNDSNSPNSLNSPNSNIKENISSNEKLHYIVALHGLQLSNKKVVIPKYNNLPFYIKLYIDRGNILVFTEIRKEIGNICFDNKEISVLKEIMRSGQEVDDILFENDIPNNFGLYYCQNNKIVGYRTFDFFRLDLITLINMIFNLNNTENYGRPFRMSILSCRGYPNEEGKMREQHYEAIEKINPNIELVNEMDKLNLYYSLKKWTFTEEQYIYFQPVECVIPKERQFGCALQTLVFLGELEKTEQLKREIFEASINKKPTAHKIIDILNKNNSDLYNNTLLNNNYIYKNFPIQVELTGKLEKYFLSPDILLICKNLKNYEATLIKMNRLNSRVSHVICILKKDNICRFIDPQQIKEYTIEEFVNFAYDFNINSIDVIFEKEKDN